jgi:nitrile hydratase
MQGFGPVEREANEPVFHARWEGTVAALNRGLMSLGVYNVDEMRAGIETMAPLDYLAASYYERWLATVQANLIRKGIVDPAAVEARLEQVRDDPEWKPPRRVDPGLTERVLHSSKRAPSLTAAPSPRFQVGDTVVTRNAHPVGHTRLPRYARGKRGVIHRVNGLASFPDSSAHGDGPQPQPLYNVAFAAAELWGETAEPGATVYLDLWESYLGSIASSGPTE